MPTLTDIRTVREILSRHGFSFSKALGQNFLINPSVCPRMAQSCHPDLDGDFAVLEIGPGLGVLTKELAQVARRVISIELDTRLLPILQETLAEYDNITIISGDALKLDLAEILNTHAKGLPVVVCANLPYYITSPILMHLLESRLPFESVTVLVQKEAAQRLCAVPGTRECGAISLAVSYFAKPEILFSVSRGSFMPAPNVDSCVIQLRLRKTPPCELVDEALFFRLIHAAFQQRRKTLANSLCNAGFSKEVVREVLQKVNLSPTARAEEISLEQFATLTEAFYEIKKAV